MHDPYRAATAAGMILVSGIAACVSFLHIESLAIRYGQPHVAAYLLPLSIDGTIVVASMSMLRAARLQTSTPFLARAMLLLSIGATLACNTAFGLTHGVPGALLSGWPAVAFTGSAELAIGMTRRKVSKTAVPKPLTSVQTAANEIAVTDSPGVDEFVFSGDSTSRQTGARLDRMKTQELTALSVLTERPDMSFSELAAVLGTSERTARRVKDRIRASMNGKAPVAA